MPRSAVYTESGGTDVLSVIDKSLVDPGFGELRVRLHFSGVNPTDWKARSGQGFEPLVGARSPGHDGSGVVDAVGPGVDPTLVGVAVWVWGSVYQRSEGTAQDYAIVLADRVTRLPEGASFELGASLGVPFMTAHRCLTLASPDSTLAPGSLAGGRVLVAGGAGAVGNAAIQLARWAGAQVLTTVSSTEKAELARAAGAHHVVNYREAALADEVRAWAPDGVDLVVEVSPSTNLPVDVEVLTHGGYVAIYATNGGPEITAPIRTLMAKSLRIQAFLIFREPRSALEAAMRDINAAIVDGDIGIGAEHGLPIHRFDLEGIGAAHAAVEAGTVGKVLIDLAAGA